MEPVSEKQNKRGTTREYLMADIFHAALHGDSKKIDVNLERGRKEMRQAEKLGLEIQVMRGELVSWELVRRAWDSMISKLRAHLLPLGGVLAVKVSVLDTYEECKEVLDQGIHDALKELSTASQEIDIGDAEAPTEANGLGVGGSGEEAESGGERGTGDMAN